MNQDRTVSLHTVLSEVDATLVGKKVPLLQDPTPPPERALDLLHGGHTADQSTLRDARDGLLAPPLVGLTGLQGRLAMAVQASLSLRIVIRQHRVGLPSSNSRCTCG